MEKKEYVQPQSEAIEFDLVLMDTVSGEQENSGVKEGEGGDDLSRMDDDLWD